MTRDDEEFVPIPLDAETIRRLARLGQRVGKHPVRCAGELLRSLLDNYERDASIIRASPLN